MKKFVAEIAAAGVLLTGCVSNVSHDSTRVHADMDLSQFAVPDVPMEPAVKTELTNTFKMVQDYWVEHGVDLSGVELVLLENNDSVSCGDKIINAHTSNGASYCKGTDEVIISQEFVASGARRIVGRPTNGTFLFVITHELGHAVDDVTNIEDQIDTASAIAQDNVTERHADCLAGEAMAVLWPEEVHEVSLQLVHLEGFDFTHGSGRERNRQFMIGASGKACELLPTAQFEFDDYEG